MTISIRTLDDPTPTLAELDLWPAMNAAEVARGEPVQHGRAVHHDEGTGLSVGTWHCTPYESPLMHYPVDEYMVVLGGVVSIVHEDGYVLTLRAGEGFFMPKGLKAIWRQDQPLLKHFVIYDDGTPPNGAFNSSQKAIRFDATSGPDHPLRTADGRFTVYLERPAQPILREGEADAFHHVLAGRATIEAAGLRTTIAAGRSLFVPRGTPYQLTGDALSAVVTCSRA